MISPLMAFRDLVSQEVPNPIKACFTDRYNAYFLLTVSCNTRYGVLEVNAYIACHTNL